MKQHPDRLFKTVKVIISSSFILIDLRNTRNQGFIGQKSASENACLSEWNTFVFIKKSSPIKLSSLLKLSRLSRLWAVKFCWAKLFYFFGCDSWIEIPQRKWRQKDPIYGTQFYFLCHYFDIFLGGKNALKIVQLVARSVFPKPFQQWRHRLIAGPLSWILWGKSYCAAPGLFCILETRGLNTSTWI